MTMEELGYALEEGASTPQPEVLVDQESYLVQFSLAGAIQIRRWKHFEKLLLFSKRFFLPATRNWSSQPSLRGRCDRRENRPHLRALERKWPPAIFFKSIRPRNKDAMSVQAV
jgi:hypothetical protein